MALYGQGWMSQGEVTEPGGFHLPRAEGLKATIHIHMGELEQQSGSPSKHCSWFWYNSPNWRAHYRRGRR